MIVPQFWAEARIQQRVAGRQITVRRFGWSDASQEEAQAHADSRAREAFGHIAAGETLPRREPKLAYNGAEGVPIREEIVARHGEVVVTRNLYGARCLNTPDVLFVDVDFPLAPSLSCTLILILLAVGVAVGWVIGSFAWGIGIVVAAILLGDLIVRKSYRRSLGAAGKLEQKAIGRIERFLRDKPDWHIRVYRTPAGLRLLVMHRTFEPREPAVAECFHAFQADPIYARMCAHQRCFRARVSPKPWRIGIDRRLRPRPGVWPIRPERMAERQQWVDAYEQAAVHYAACEFVAALGSATVCPATVAVQELHDRLCRVDAALPMA